jgi:menaquinone-dependent protoporphyrinogen oxidase
MRVLVAYASRYGATRGIAERIAETLRQAGQQTTLQPAGSAGSPAEYDAAVIGSAAYFFHWMKPCARYVRRYRSILAQRPVWLFSSGPLGTEPKDAQGRDLRVVTEPKEIPEFLEAIHPRDHRVFFGAIDSSKFGFLHRLLNRMPANRGKALFPEGDFRDWNEIDAWSTGIAQALKTIEKLGT